MAFAFKRKGTNQIVCNFFGEGTTNKGDWHEAMNLAALWKLPVVFLCENNLYGVTTHITDVIVLEKISDRAAAYGMPGVTIYGNDPIFVYDQVKEAVGRAREGKGPTLIESLTYRRGGHKRDDPATYRPQDEVKAWLSQDPIPIFRDRLLIDSRYEEPTVKAMEDKVKDILENAVSFAMSSDDPPTSLALEHVYG
jgi:pyruvate dehydrogenase E1 component alpha subunit